MAVSYCDALNSFSASDRSEIKFLDSGLGLDICASANPTKSIMKKNNM
jgi:hypothetical protein